MSFRKICIIASLLFVGGSAFAQEVKSKNSDIFDFGVPAIFTDKTDKTADTKDEKKDEKPETKPDTSTSTKTEDTKPDTSTDTKPETKTEDKTETPPKDATPAETKAIAVSGVQKLLLLKYKAAFDKVVDDMLAGFEKNKTPIADQVKALQDLRLRLETKKVLIQDKKDLDPLKKAVLTEVIKYVIGRIDTYVDTLEVPKEDEK